MAYYRVIVSDTRGGVINLATAGGWTLLQPIRAFEEIDTLDDNSLGDVGRLFVKKPGFVALARKESDGIGG